MSASTVYRLRYLGDPALRVVCQPVTPENAAELPALVDALQRIRADHSGLGLSANQIGGTLRVFVARIGVTETGVFINPQIVNDRGALVPFREEGCLSIPGFRTSTKRHAYVHLAWDTRDGERVTHTFLANDAQVVQHELDHLDGRLIVDGLSRQQQRQADRCVMKATAFRVKR